VIIEKINHDLRLAIKEKDPHRVSALRMLKAALTHKSKERSTGDQHLSDGEISIVLRRLIKTYREEMSFHGAASPRHAELSLGVSILEQYLSPRLTRGQLEEVISQVVRPGDSYDKVMRVLSLQLKDRADLLEVADLVRAKLGGDP